MQASLLYDIALVRISGIGTVIARQLVSYCGSSETIFKTTPAKLLKIPKIGEKLVLTIQAEAQKALKEAEQEIQKAEKLGVDILSCYSPDYPQRMRSLHDSPFLLYSKGKTEYNVSKSVAIVGTRNATAYGRSFTDELISELKKYNPLIVSGLAYGIDIQAHRAALKHGLATTAVMASGIDIIYPHTHKATALQMVEQGGSLVSEQVIGTAPDAPRFPERNRIIAGMADVVIVVEAAIKGGALITAEVANDYNREVMAVPGNVGAKMSEGCNRLIKQHKAHILTSFQDIEECMGWDIKNNPTKIQAPTQELFPDLNEDERKILNFIKSKETAQIDDISFYTLINMSQTMSLLFSLEFKGLVKAMPGKKYKAL